MNDSNPAASTSNKSGPSTPNRPPNALPPPETDGTATTPGPASALLSSRQAGFHGTIKAINIKGKKEVHKPKILVTSDELNILIYSYLCESSFPHTAYTFRSESNLDTSPLFNSFNPDREGSFPGPGAPPRTSVRETKGKGRAGKKGESEAGAEGDADVEDEAEGDRMDIDSPAAESTTTTGKKGKGKEAPNSRKSSGRHATPGSNREGTAGPENLQEDEEKFRAVPRGELIRHLYKGLMWDEVEKHAKLGWMEPPPCVSPFTLLHSHSCTYAIPGRNEGPTIPPVLINRKTGAPIYSALLTREERAAIRGEPTGRGDIFPPAAEGSRLERLERVLGERKSGFEPPPRRERREREDTEHAGRREREITSGKGKTPVRSNAALEEDVEMEDVRETAREVEPPVKERSKVKEGKRRVAEDGEGMNGQAGSTRDLERRERDRDKDRDREKEKETTTTAPTYGLGKKKKRVMSSDEQDMPVPNGIVGSVRTKKRDETQGQNGLDIVMASRKDSEKRTTIKKRDDGERERTVVKPKQEDAAAIKKRKLVNGDSEAREREVRRKDSQREALGVSAGPSSSKGNRIVSDQTVTESEAEARKSNKKPGRPRRNSNASNVTKSEKSGERRQGDDGRSVSQTPTPAVGAGIKAIFAGHKNPFQPVERDGMLCWRGHTKRINKVSWNPLNLTRLISCSQDGLCNIWDFTDSLSANDKQLRLLARLPIELVHKALETKKPVLDLAWNNDGNAFVTIDKDNVARSFVGDGELQGTGYRHEREITCLAWNPNGNYFATTNIDGQTCVWDISVVPIKLKNSWDHHAPHKAYHVDWLTNEIFATCSEDNTIALCSVNSVDRLTVLSKHRDRVLVCKFSPKLQAADKLSPTTKRLLASGSDDHTVRIWDMQGVEDEGAKVFTNGRDQSKQPKELLKLEGHVDDIQLVQWCPRLRADGKRLLATMSMADPQSDSADRHVIKMYDVNAKDGEYCLYTITEHQEEIRSLEFSPAGDMFLSCSEDGFLYIWDSETGTRRKQFSAGAAICDAQWRPDGEQLALAMADATLRTLYVGDLLRKAST